MNLSHTGWRRAQPPISYAPPPGDREAVFEAARLAGRALDLPAGCRFVLDQLCAAFRGEFIEDRVMVWPSNAFLIEKTGLAERTVRLCLARLIALEVIVARDSPNGKRYAQRGRDGSIQRAYGFDLSPLLARLSEFKDRVIAQEDERRDRARAFDDLTVHRRSALEALRTLQESHPHIDTHNLASRMTSASSGLPRRSGAQAPYAVRDLWKTLREEAEKFLKESGSGGNSCRHKDTNTKAPESSCYSGNEDDEALAVIEVIDICRDAKDLIGVVRSEQELVAAAERMRGMLGISRSAWTEAAGKLGPLMASLILVYVIQVQARPAPGARQIENLGGYYRFICRKVMSGQIEFEAEVRKLRDRMM